MPQNTVANKNPQNIKGIDLIICLLTIQNYSVPYKEKTPSQVTATEVSTPGYIYKDDIYLKI